MALKTITKHYANPCDKLDCICEGADVALFLAGDVLTTAGKAYVAGIVSSVTALSTGGIDVVIAYDDAPLPVDFEVSFTVGSTEGTVYDPDCLTPGSWLWKTEKLFGAGQNPAIINRAHPVYLNDEHVADNTFDLARIPFGEGMRLTAVKLTCARYDANTTLTATLKVGSTVIASYTGTLARIRAMEIAVNDLLEDEKPTLYVTDVESVIYSDGALGLVLELIGILVPQ